MQKTKEREKKTQIGYPRKEMAYQNTLYEHHKRNVHSQNGEDGLIEVMIQMMFLQEKLDWKKQWVCEFGAWDGKYLSNTFALVEKGAKAVYIEGDGTKFNDLLQTVKKYPNIIPICAYVSHEKNAPDSLDRLLVRTDIPNDFLLLSIDIDSYDYQVWETVEAYRPRIVIIEINSSIEPHRLDYIHDGQKCQGTCFGATYALAKKKGYALVAHTGNMVFVRMEDAKFFPIPVDPTTCFRTNWMLQK